MAEEVLDRLPEGLWSRVTLPTSAAAWTREAKHKFGQDHQSKDSGWFFFSLCTTPLPVGSRPIPAGWEGAEEHAGAIYIFRSGWIKPTEEMCRESLFLLHTLFRKLGLQSISHLWYFFSFFPGCWWLCSWKKMHGEWEVRVEHVQAPARCPGSAQPLFIGGARTFLQLPRTPLGKNWKSLCLTGAMVSRDSRCCPYHRHSSIWVRHNSFYKESSL